MFSTETSWLHLTFKEKIQRFIRIYCTKGIKREILDNPQERKDEKPCPLKEVKKKRSETNLYCETKKKQKEVKWKLSYELLNSF